MKFRAAADGGKAVLKGKVWKRGEAEPEEWTIEAVDEAPNLVGSPGLFGNAQHFGNLYRQRHGHEERAEVKPVPLADR